MNKYDKLQAIKDMGIDLDYHCPRDFGLKELNLCNVNDPHEECFKCFVSALED